jgi:hypothetical protein
MIISLIVSLILLGLVWWLVTFIPMPAPIGQIVQVLFIIAAVCIVLSAFGLLPASLHRLL